MAEEETDFTTANTNITSRNIAELSDMTVKLSHEALAESHNLSVRLTLGIEVRTALTTTHGECGQRVLQNLLKAKELKDREVNSRVETKTTFVRTDSAVELDTETTIDMHVTLIASPWDAELDYTFGLHHTLEDGDVFGLLVEDGFKRLQDLEHSLLELRLRTVALLDDGFQILDRLGWHNLWSEKVKIDLEFPIKIMPK